MTEKQFHMKYHKPKMTKATLDWKQAKLKEIGTFSKGAGISKSETLPAGLNAVRYGELYTRHHFQIKKIWSFISKDTAKTSKKIKFGDIIFAGSGETIDEIGKSAAYLFHEDCYAGGDTIIFTPQNCDSRFLSFLLNTGKARKELRRLGQGQSVVHIYKSDIESISISLPPLHEQEKIVKVLLTWDSYLEKLTASIKIKKKVKKGLMQKLLTGKMRMKGFSDMWKTTKVGKIGEIISGSTPSTLNPDYWNGNISWVTPSEITKIKGKYIRNTERKITVTGLNSCSAKTIPPQSLILCSRATVGDCAINLSEITTNQGFKNIIPDNKVLNIDFLYYWIKTKKHYLKRISSGSTFLEFSKHDLVKTKISLPPLPEQSAIAEILTTADLEIEALEKKKYLFEMQKKFLLNNLITGRIRLPEFTKVSN